MSPTKYRLLSSVLFITVLLVKLVLTVSPAFFEIKNQIIVQFDKDNKSDKDDPDKETSKDKKSFDEGFVYCIEHTMIVSLICVSKNLSFKQPVHLPEYYATVQTPPPNSHLD